MTLTRPQIESMEAGREMDAECARVSGWVQVEQLPDSNWAGRSKGNPNRLAEYIPAFSTDLAAAMTLLDALPYSHAVKRIGTELSCSIYLPIHSKPATIRATGETRPLAVCRARLLLAESEATR